MSGCRTDFNPVSLDSATGVAQALVLVNRQHHDRRACPAASPAEGGARGGHRPAA